MMGTISAVSILQLLEALTAVGAERETLCASASLDSDSLADPTAVLPRDIVESLFDEAERQTGDLLVGLRAGQATLGRTWLYHLALSHGSLREALQSVSRFASQVSDTLHLDLIDAGDAAWFRISVEGDEPASPRESEYFAGMVLGNLSHLTRHQISVSEVHFMHAPRASARDYEQLLGAPVAFRQPDCQIGFGADALSAAIPTANPQVAMTLARQVPRPLAHAGAIAGRSTQTLEELVRTARGRSRADVARALGMSPRTLQRNLEREGTSFREIRDKVLHAYAVELLADRALSLREIAERLEYTDATAFGRAFRRWAGESPLDYRRRT